MKKFSDKLRHPMWLAAIMLFTIYLFIGKDYRFTYNHGESMRPTYQDGEWLVVQHKSTLPDDWGPDRYDNVIVDTDGERLSKRVIALEGEHVKILHGKIFINGKERKDPYGKGSVIYWLEPEEETAKNPEDEWVFLNTDEDIGLVGKGEVFVMGDNRKLSWYGKVKVKDIKGLVIF